jgi:hypothetical protein
MDRRHEHELKLGSGYGGSEFFLVQHQLITVTDALRSQ